MPLPSPALLPAAERVHLPDRGELGLRDLGPRHGVPIFLLHGWTVSSDLNWFAVYDALATGYRVIAFDHRGHGEGLRSRQRFRLSDCADDAVAVADHLGIERFVAVGYSMGGSVAQLLARDHARRLRGMVLCATARRFHGPGRERYRFSLLQPIAGATRIVPPVVRQQLYHQLLAARAERDDLGAWAALEVGKADPQALLDAGAELFRFDSSAWLGEITTPTAVVITENDGSVPARRQLRLAEAIPGATVHPIRGGHSVCVTGPSRFLRGLESALQSVLARPN